MAPKETLAWTPLRKKLQGLDKPELLDLLKDLFDFSSDNRAFLAARFKTGGEGSAALEGYRQRILRQFVPERGLPRLKLAVARKAIRDYRKATGDPAGTVDLMLSYVEGGIVVTEEYGDMGEELYASLESVLGEAVELLRSPEGVEIYPLFAERLRELVGDTRHVGWGFGFFVADQVEDLEAFMERAG